MTISRKPAARDNAAIGAFIAGAPDARTETPATPSGNPAARRSKVKISIDIDPDLLARVDQVAKASGVSRNAALALGASWLIDDFESRTARRNG
ncbi:MULTISPECIES: ribbon-helix-helix protein, CopG family [Burkholderia cepacia complex]|uniref:ribbon-helix-helix protein, CopG family n=1 Tax=Burkholderia cepacia complex TaxID=87882 RepID=UPI001593DDB2|nr:MULTISPECIES: ribbon-helix-helix protein, CopG family [Burkholderia cepacia complex]MCA8156192.1 ribbon-helix-helix protein, CopG family [Burkholderia contaminans]MCA8207966.1 ribbon-helix-helix protein, CopG family [Burkholderia vietnamiensis]